MTAAPGQPAVLAKNSGRRRSGSRQGFRRSRGLTTVGLLGCVAVAAAAPILAGGVHRPVMVGLMGAGLLGLALFAGGLWLEGSRPRIGFAVVLPVLFLLVPLVQSVPIPTALRSLFDAEGTGLLRDSQPVVTSSWPLSLDPVVTRVYVGRAALALLTFIVAFHLASGRSRRGLMIKVIGAAGIAAVVIGIGHRVLGFDKLYGVFKAQLRPLLVGPFVNANHTAELLELSAFVCLACSFQRPTTLNRVGWMIGTLLCAGGAAATLSRGAAAALVVGTLFFVVTQYFAVDAQKQNGRRASLAGAVILLGLVVLGAVALGAGQLVERFKTDAVGTDVRFRLWGQGLHVLAAHPFGIGRGAFDRVFPVYRSFTMPFSVRFAFLENEPLQLLIDCGWFFFLLLAAAVASVGWLIVRHGRRDRIEAALLGGVFAVLAHSIVDFGLETLGVLLPFTAVLGTLLGRLRVTDDDRRRLGSRASFSLCALAACGLVFGIVSTARASNDNFDALLARPMSPDARRELIARARQAHPIDYFYALSEARTLPLKAAPGLPSPRLHALNRALRLCPRCEAVHEDVARNLWVMGLRRQALLEWRTAVEIQPTLFAATLGELFAAGAKPEELASIGASSPGRLLELVTFLEGRGRVADAFVVLDQADAIGAPRAQSLLARASLQLSQGQLQAAAATLDAGRDLRIQDPQWSVLESKLLLRLQDTPEAADQALQILDVAAARWPTDLPVQLERIELVGEHKKWKAADRALEGFKLALFHAFGSATDAHIVGARFDQQLGRSTAALEEYRIALADRSNDVSLWIEYARAAAANGRKTIAFDALAQAARLSPNSVDIANAQHELEGHDPIPPGGYQASPRPVGP